MFHLSVKTDVREIPIRVPSVVAVKSVARADAESAAAAIAAPNRDVSYGATVVPIRQ